MDNFDLKKYLAEGRSLKEQPSEVQVFQQKRIDAFEALDKDIVSLLQQIRDAKVNTIKYYKDNPKSFEVIYPTDLITDYINDIKTILSPDEE